MAPVVDAQTASRRFLNEAFGRKVFQRLADHFTRGTYFFRQRHIGDFAFDVQFAVAPLQGQLPQGAGHASLHADGGQPDDLPIGAHQVAGHGLEQATRDLRVFLQNRHKLLRVQYQRVQWAVGHHIGAMGLLVQHRHFADAVAHTQAGNADDFVVVALQFHAGSATENEQHVPGGLTGRYQVFTALERLLVSRLGQ